MLWVLIWLVLALGAVLVFFLIGRRLWRQLKALTAELRTASDRLAEINDRLAEIDAHPDGHADGGPHGVGGAPDGVRSQGPRQVGPRRRP